MKNSVSDDARISGIPIFSKIARENHEQALSLESQIDKAAGKLSVSTEQDLGKLEIEIAKCSLVTVVFTAVAIEAYIYDYAARHFSDEFIKDHIDKLDLLSKWVIVPKLITGKELPKGRKWFELLKNIVGARNLIVHSKSLPVPAIENIKKQFQKIREQDDKIYQAAKQSTKLFDLLIKEISEIDPEEKDWIQLHLSENQ